MTTLVRVLIAHNGNTGHAFIDPASVSCVAAVAPDRCEVSCGRSVFFSPMDALDFVTALGLAEDNTRREYELATRIWINGLATRSWINQ